MITLMAKVRIVGPRFTLDELTERLQLMGVVHIESSPVHTEAERLERFSLEPDYQKKKELLERVLKDLSRLTLALPQVRETRPGGIQADELFVIGGRLLERILRSLDEAKPEIEAVLNSIRECEEEQNLLVRYEKVLEALAPFLAQVRESQKLDYIGVILEVPSGERGTGDGEGPFIQGIRQALSELTSGRFELFLSRIDSETVAGLLVVPHDLSARVRASLWEENISQLRLPASVSDKPIGQALQILLEKRVELPARIQELHGSLLRFSRRWSGELQEYKNIVENWLVRLESTLYFYQTRSTFLLYGWIPEKDFSKVNHQLNEVFGGKVVMERMAIVPEELKNVPVALENPPLFRPFESFTRLVSLPYYGSIDPTPYVGLFFPLFYGMILGDIGYGVVLLLLALYARHRWEAHPLVRNLSSIFILSSISAILFGFLYGEFFGELGEPLGIHPLVLDRMESFALLFKMTLGVGLAHVLLGILLGIVTAHRHRDYREAGVKICGLFFLLSLCGLIAGYAGFIARPFALAGGILASINLFLLFALGGARAAMELHNVVNVMSYLRLMGIGVASAAFAFAANTLGGLGGPVLFVGLILLMFHLINFLFGVLSPTIQSLRLHYVEFFENFFQAGGLEYRPFRKV